MCQVVIQNTGRLVVIDNRSALSTSATLSFLGVALIILSACTLSLTAGAIGIRKIRQTVELDKIFNAVAKQAVENVHEGLIDSYRKHWNYVLSSPSGPNSWETFYTNCSKLNIPLQSPIDIITELVWKSRKPEAIKFTDNYLYPDHADCNVRLAVIDGRELKIQNVSSAYRLTGAGMDHESYTLREIRVHFGCSDDAGSDHRINGLAFPMELQLIHMIEKPVRDARSIATAAVSVLFTFSENDVDNSVLASFFEQVEDVVNHEASPIRKFCFNIAKLMNAFDREQLNYYRYHGSLTNPPCESPVLWSILKRPLQISRTQMNALRRLVEKYPTLKNNYRPVQATSANRLTLDGYSSRSSRNFTLLFSGDVSAAAVGQYAQLLTSVRMFKFACIYFGFCVFVE